MSITFLRHFETEVDPEEPQSEWNLSESGENQQEEFIETAEFDYDAVYSSPEKKALKTAREISERYDIPLIVSSDLKEVDRSGEGFIEDHDRYVEMVEEFLTAEEVDFDWEDYESVQERLLSFYESVDREKNILAVTHGMILSTFLPKLFEKDGFKFWRGLGFGETFTVKPADIREVVK